MNKRNLAIALFISVTAGILTLYNKSVSTSDIKSNEISTSSVGLPTFTFPQTYEGCGYMWAYHDDSKLSAEVDKAIRGLNPTAGANAQLFGEDCVYADGHSTFGVMETDFYVRLTVNDLEPTEEFGNWIKQVMDFITGLPEDKVQGNKGFVEFSFIKNDAERTILRIGITDYQSSAAGATGLELLQKFYTPTPPTTTP